MSKRRKQRWDHVPGQEKAKSEPEELLALQIRAEGLPEPEREQELVSGRKWRVDFVWRNYGGGSCKGIVCEVEGGTASGMSRHTRPAGFEEDCDKYNTHKAQGWDVYRFTSQQVRSGKAIDFLKLVLK